MYKYDKVECVKYTPDGSWHIYGWNGLASSLVAVRKTKFFAWWLAKRVLHERQNSRSFTLRRDNS